MRSYFIYIHNIFISFYMMDGFTKPLFSFTLLGGLVKGRFVVTLSYLLLVLREALPFVKVLLLFTLDIG